MKNNLQHDKSARRAFIEKHKNLFWFTPTDKKIEVSDSVLVETILNYGDLDALRSLIELLGLRYTATIFRQHAQQQRSNYFNEIAHFFTLYFNKYAPQYS